MNSSFNSKFITVHVIDSNFTSDVVVYSLYKLHNPLLNTKFLHGPRNGFSWFSMECLFKGSEVQFPVLNQMFFLQLSEDEYCISFALTNHEAKLHIIDEYSFTDYLFHHSFNSFEGIPDQGV